MGIAAAQSPNGEAASPATDSSRDEWSFSLNVAGYIVPHDRSYASPTFSADRGHFHFGSRYNYEDKETGSLWFGYDLQAGEKLVFRATPMVGGVFGNTTGEFVFDTRNSAGNFFYSWTELSYTPRDWCRVGLVAQRTKAYQTSLDIQRGILIGLSHKKVNFTTYIFNAGWTDPTVVLSLGFNF